MIDIHSHYIPFVDDGSKSVEDSINLLKNASSIGITDIICTPHYRRHMFETSVEEIKNNFSLLQDKAKAANININLYLGREVYLHHVNDLNGLLTNGVVIPLNNTKYLLLEFSYTNDIDISEVVYLAKLAGYYPIIAHIERYEYVDLDMANEIKEAGALIQVNASSITGREGLKVKKRALKVLENGLASFVASDVHVKRHNDMQKAFKVVSRKLGHAKAEELFTSNAKILIEKEESI